MPGGIFWQRRTPCARCDEQVHLECADQWPVVARADCAVCHQPIRKETSDTIALYLVIAILVLCFVYRVVTRDAREDSNAAIDYWAHLTNYVILIFNQITLLPRTIVSWCMLL